MLRPLPAVLELKLSFSKYVRAFETMRRPAWRGALAGARASGPPGTFR